MQGSEGHSGGVLVVGNGWNSQGSSELCVEVDSLLMSGWGLPECHFSHN